jgi:hypothetical protein
MGLRLDRVFDRCGGTRVVLAPVDEPWWRDGAFVKDFFMVDHDGEPA